MAYNGWKDWETWNVALWINNDENLYNMAQENIKLFKPFVAAEVMFEELNRDNIFETPDKALYTPERILAAIRDMA
jgi:hypothetical protein